MSEERKISDDELVEITGGADGPIIELDRSKLGDDDQDADPGLGSDAPSTPGGPGNPPENVGGGGGGASHLA